MKPNSTGTKDSSPGHPAPPDRTLPAGHLVLTVAILVCALGSWYAGRAEIAALSAMPGIDSQ